MRYKILTLILIAVFINLQPVLGSENEYGIVNAWFNGEKATVNGAQLKIGEPFELKVNLSSKIEGDVSFKLYEPGVTKAFVVLNGPSEIEKRIDIMNIESGWSKTYTWSIAPNGEWKEGNAPLNVIVQFNKGMNNKQIDFTIANPYILDEQYPGAAAKGTAPKVTDTAAPPMAAPFVPIIFVFALLLLARQRQK